MLQAKPSTREEGDTSLIPRHSLTTVGVVVVVLQVVCLIAFLSLSILNIHENTSSNEVVCNHPPPANTLNPTLTYGSTPGEPTSPLSEGEVPGMAVGTTVISNEKKNKQMRTSDCRSDKEDCSQLAIQPILCGCEPGDSESDVLVTTVQKRSGEKLQKASFNHAQTFSSMPTDLTCASLGWGKLHKNPPKVFYAITFSQEVRMLELLLNELYDVVDHFIIAESDVLSSGTQRREYKWPQIQHERRFSRFLDKIEHVKHNGTYVGEGSTIVKTKQTSWNNLRGHRQAAFTRAQQLSTSKNDRFILADADEIIKAPLLATAKMCTGSPDSINAGSEVYLYTLTCLTTFIGKPVITTMREVEKLGRVDKSRTLGKGYVVSRGAWHFSSFMSMDSFILKVSGYSHQDRNTKNHKDKVYIRDNMYSTCGYLNEKHAAFGIGPNFNLPPPNSLPKHMWKNRDGVFKDFFETQGYERKSIERARPFGNDFKWELTKFPNPTNTSKYCEEMGLSVRTSYED